MIKKTKTIMVAIIVSMMVVSVGMPLISGDAGLTDAETIQGGWVESYDEQAAGLSGEVSFEALASNGSTSVNPNGSGTFQRQDDNYGLFSYDASRSDVGWQPSSPSTGEDVYFISETHTGGYVWASWREANGSTLVKPQTDLSAQYEQIPQPNATAVGENYIEITVESPDYTDYSVDRGQSVNGTYDLFDSYAVYMSDDGGSTWQYLNNTQSVSGTYDAPIQPDYTDAQAVNPDNVTTGENRLVADGLNPNTDYEFKVRMNLDFGGIEGGYNDGVGTGVYTTNSTGPSTGPITTDWSSTQGGNELQGYFYESYDGEAKFFDGSNYYGNISVVDYGNPDNIAVNNDTGGWSNGTSLGSFQWKANEGNNSWSMGSPAVGNHTYFVNEVPEGDVSGNASYVWSAQREVEGDFVADPQSNMTGQYEKMPTPIRKEVGEDWIELQVESPDYTDWNENTSTSPGMGTYDEFVSYSVFIRGGSYTDWTYLNSTESMSEAEYGGTYDAPLIPGSSTDPSTVTTGMNRLNTSWDDTLNAGGQYEFKVRMNLGNGLYGGYNGGYDNAYTTWGSGAKQQITTNRTQLTVQEPSQGYERIFVNGTWYNNTASWPIQEEYVGGTVVDLEAVSAVGYHFVEWTGDNGTIGDTESNQTTITMDGDKTITAKFEPDTHTLNISSTAGGAVDAPGEGEFEYDYGTIVNLTAVANTGYHFIEWTGDNGTIGDRTNNQTDIEMLANYTITADFAINNYTLDLSSTTGGSVTQPGQGTFNRDHGTTVDLEAVANDGYHFVEWTGDTGMIGDTTNNQTTITMEGNYVVTAQFAINNYTLDISSTTGGIVTQPGQGTFNRDHGTTVDLEAVANDGYHFVEWTGDTGMIGDTTSNQTTITMEGDYAITAHFDPNELDRVEIDPSEDQTITAGDTIDFDAAAYDEFGNLVEDDDTAFTWQNTDNTGIFDETTVGNYDVTATYGGITSSVTSVRVDPGPVDRIVIIEYPDVITAGESFNMTIEAYDEYDNLAAGGELDNFSINSEYDGEVQFEETIVFNETGKYVTTIPEDEVITADDEHNINATSNPSDSVNITVEPGPVDRVDIDPAEDQEVDAEEELEFTAEAYDEYGNLITDDVADFEWENIDEVDEQGDVAIFSKGDAGNYDVTATLNNVTSDPTTVTIQEVGGEPDVGVADLCNLWWIWIILAIIIILLLIWYFWRRSVTLTISEIKGEGAVHVDTIELAEVPYEEDYKKDEEVELLAYPIEDWEFSHWTGVPEEKEEDLEIVIEMDEDKTVTAVFERVEEKEEEEQEETEEEIFVEEEPQEEEQEETEEEIFEEEPQEEEFQEETEEGILEEEPQEEEFQEETEEGMLEEEPSDTPGKLVAIENLENVKGIGPTNAERLYEGGFENVDQLKEASLEELTEVKGIGTSTAEMIFENLKE